MKLVVSDLSEIDSSLHNLYEEAGDSYRLKVDGIEDTGALKRAKDHEKESRKRAEAKARELEERLSQLEQVARSAEEQKAKSSGDIDALEKSWAGKLSAREQELNAKISALNASLQHTLVDKEAEKLAASLAIEGSSALLVPHIKQRLGVQESEEGFKTMVLDEFGKPSALTIGELINEFKARPEFSPVLAGSRASGGGAQGSNKSGSALNTKTLSRTDFDNLNPGEKARFFKDGGTLKDDD